MHAGSSKAKALARNFEVVTFDDRAVEETGMLLEALYTTTQMAGYAG